MRLLKRLLVVFAVLFVGAQLVRPARTNPETDPTKVLRAPANVQAILDRSCRDCHTNDTHWPWYSGITPISFLLTHDVEEGREELSFSQWNAYTPRERDHKLEEICEQVEEGEMPLKPYLLLHPGARLSPADVQTLCGWARR
jgi:hypothetical protein